MTAQQTTQCAWSLCGALAVRERWDAIQGIYRPACAMHAGFANPFELKPLTPAVPPTTTEPAK